MCWLTVDCRRPNRRPASVKFLVWATARNDSSWMGSSISVPVIMDRDDNNIRQRGSQSSPRVRILRRDICRKDRAVTLFSRLNIDPYVVAIVGTVGVASLAPAHGEGAVLGGHATRVAIAVLFFLHGVKLEP